MSLQRNYYEVIGVPSTATTDEIKKKYRELARQFHPDVVKDKTLGQKVFTQINQAYRVLADPEKRSQYDTTLVPGMSRPANAAQSRNGSAAPVGAPAGAPLNAQDTATVARLVADAETAMMQNKLGTVKTICDKVLQADPRNVKALSILGDALVQMGKPRDAAIAYRRALQVGPSALLQAKLNRLEGAPAANGTAAAPSRPSTAPVNGMGTGLIARIKTVRIRGAAKNGGWTAGTFAGKK